MTKSFEEQFAHEKNELTEALILFSECKRVNKALADLEMNRPEFYKFYEAGQQSRQAEINELKREMINKTNEAYVDGQKSMRKMIKSNEDELRKRIDEAMKYVSESPLKDVSRRAMINFMDILKGNTNEH